MSTMILNPVKICIFTELVSEFMAKQIWTGEFAFPSEYGELFDREYNLIARQKYSEAKFNIFLSITNWNIEEWNRDYPHKAIDKNIYDAEDELAFKVHYISALMKCRDFLKSIPGRDYLQRTEIITRLALEFQYNCIGTSKKFFDSIINVGYKFSFQEKFRNNLWIETI